MHTTARNKSGRWVRAAPTSKPEFEPPKIASFPGAVRPVLMSHSAAEKKIIVSRLPVAALRGFVPLHSKFRSATNVWQRKEAATLHEKGDEDTELRRHGNSVAAIGSHNRGVAGSVENVESDRQDTWEFLCRP